MKKIDLIIKDAEELVTLAGKKKQPRRGVDEMSDLAIIKDGALAIDKGAIIAVGTTKELSNKYQALNVISARNKVVTPGLVDPHTHPVFAGSRDEEFEMRIHGATYQEISEHGGGIKSTVAHVRKTTKQKLAEQTQPYLQRFLAHGTTTIEAKSGYGLSLDDEIKLLEVIKELNHKQPLELVPTFLGAHDFPDEYRNDKRGYIRLIKEKMLPEIAHRKLAEFCDVFCEKGVFEIDASREILKEAQKYGFQLKFHADEFSPLGGAELAAELKAVSADHLMCISEKGIHQMKDNSVIAVLLPGTTFAMGLKKYAPAFHMIKSGLPIALGTDFNPGTCFSESMPLIMTIACVMMKLTPAEALTAATINAAYAINRADKIGSLEPGKQADIVIWDVPSYRHIAYHFGVNLVNKVIKKGKIIK